MLGDGIKFDKGNGKSLDHLCPPFVKHMMCRALEYGCSKYFENSWRAGFKLSRMYNSANHHLDSFFHDRENIDPESGFHHLDLALFNVAMLRYSADIEGKDDRPPVTADQIAEVIRLGMIELEKRGSKGTLQEALKIAEQAAHDATANLASLRLQLELQNDRAGLTFTK